MATAQSSGQIQFLPLTRENIESTLHTLNIVPEFDFKKFESCLETKTLARNFIYLEETTSTMDVALIVENKVPSGTVILAESQIQGKGREQRKWSSKPKGNLYFTIILGLAHTMDLFKLNIAIPVAIATVCKETGVTEIGIKWPNDVWVKTKKISGMLINSSILGTSIIAHAGIGINVNENMHENADVAEFATSIFNCLDRKVEREIFLAKFCFYLENLLHKPFVDVQEIYKSFDILVGNQVIVMPKKLENPERYTAKAVGYSQYGNLLVDCGHEGVKELLAEEVTIRPNQ